MTKRKVIKNVLYCFAWIRFPLMQVIFMFMGLIVPKKIFWDYN
jgi:hypothetical protein